MTGLNTIRRAFIKSALVLAAGAATLGLPSVSAEEYSFRVQNDTFSAGAPPPR